MKIKKSDLLSMIQEQNDVIAKLIRQVDCHHKDIIRIEGIVEPEPQLKQLDQSVFDGLDEKWRFAAVDEDGSVAVYLARPICNYLQWYVEDKSLGLSYKYFSNKKGYDTSNWQNSLIERDTAKELTGSELCRAMINRGDKIVLCIVRDYEHENDIYYDAITHCSGGYFDSTLSCWRYATPINNQGEPLTQAEAGL